MRQLACAAIVVTTALLSSRARATFSITAVDRESREVGGAIASCIQGGALDLHVAYAAAPGAGAVHAQASVDPTFKGRDEALRRLELGEAPDEIIPIITASSFDPAAQTRQFGLVHLDYEPATFTGENTRTFQGGVTGASGRRGYAIQGNILTGETVLTAAERAFREPACDLAEQLMNALEAAGSDGQGDRRCTVLDSPIAADQALLSVTAADGSTVVELHVADTRPLDAVAALRQEFSSWRAANPCRAAASVGSQASHGCSCRLAARTAEPSYAWLALLALVCARRRRG